MSFKKKPKTINPDEVDPSVYYYDEVYDDMKNEEQDELKNRSGSSKSEPKRPKYTQGLVESAEQRKSERELRKFKKYARDRLEAEGDLKDEEVFLTSSYKKKLVEIEKLEKEHAAKLKLEKDRSLNFSRKQLGQDSGQKSRHLSTQVEVEPGSKVTRDYAEEKLGDCSRKQDSDKSTVIEEKKESSREKRQFKTFEERRNYLREVLAKRTIGEKYHEAVRRYIERKSQSQSCS